MRRLFKITLPYSLPIAVGLVASHVFFAATVSWATIAFILPVSLCIGALYAVGVEYTMRNMAKSVRIDLFPGETVIKETGSTCVKGNAGFPGRTFLTTTQLIFKSKKINGKDFEERMDFDTINSLNTKDFWFGPTYDLIILRGEGQIFRFIVNSPEEWMEAIEKRRKLNAIAS